MTRAQLGLLLLLVVPVLWLGLRAGWRGRQRRQASLPELPAVPVDLTDVVAGPFEATYVSTTTEGDWLDRVAARGLGVRSAALVGVHPGGVMVARTGAPDLWVPAAALVGARRERGIAGKFVERDGLVVLTWTLGTTALDTGLRLRHDADRVALDAALDALRSDGRDVEVPHG